MFCQSLYIVSDHCFWFEVITEPTKNLIRWAATYYEPFSHERGAGATGVGAAVAAADEHCEDGEEPANDPGSQHDGGHRRRHVDSSAAADHHGACWSNDVHLPNRAVQHHLHNSRTIRVRSVKRQGSHVPSRRVGRMLISFSLKLKKKLKTGHLYSALSCELTGVLKMEDQKMLTHL